jgi:transcription initiation factor TFIIB
LSHSDDLPDARIERCKKPLPRGRKEVVESAPHGETISERGGGSENCSNCGGQIIRDIERGQYVCKDCGTVMGYPIYSPECGLSLGDSVRNGGFIMAAMINSGPPTTMAFHDLGISTEIAGGFRDAKGKVLVGKARYRAILLRKWHSRMRTKDTRDLSIAKALTSLNDLADRLDLPEYVRKEASIIYRKIVKKRLTMGRCRDTFVAVSVYAAIRRAKLPLMLRDLLPVVQLGFSEFNRYLNVLKRETGIDVPPPDPVAWIPKIASECHFSPQCQLLAAKYVRSMVKAGETFGMLPHTVAAIALYRMGALNGERKNIYKIAKLANCAATSIIKGLVSESEALRNCRKNRAVEYRSLHMEKNRVQYDYPIRCGEKVPSTISDGRLSVPNQLGE